MEDKRSRTPDDEELLRAAAGGDDDARATLAVRHLPVVCAYADLVADDPADAEDAARGALDDVVDAAARATDAPEGALVVSPAGTALPAEPVAMRLLRAARERSLAAIAARRAREGEPRPSDDPVRAANLALPVAQREALALREVAGLTFDEIGKVTGLSPLAVAQSSWRGLGRLRSLATGSAGGVEVVSRDCERALTLITLARDEPLPPELEAGVERHVAGCAACQASSTALADGHKTYTAWARARAAAPEIAAAGAAAATAAVAGEPADAPATVAPTPEVAPRAAPPTPRARPRRGVRRRGALAPAAGLATLALLVGGGAVQLVLLSREDDREQRDDAVRRIATRPPAPSARPDGDRERGGGDRADRRAEQPQPRRAPTRVARRAPALPAGITGRGGRGVVRLPRGSRPARPAPSRPRPAGRRPTSPPAPVAPQPAPSPADAQPTPAPNDTPAAPVVAQQPAPAPSVTRRGGKPARKPAGGAPGLGGDVPPGHGGSPPGQSPGKPPGHGGDVKPPGHGGTPPGQAKKRG